MTNAKTVKQIKAQVPQILESLAAVFVHGFSNNKIVMQKASFRDLVTKTDKTIENLFAEWIKLNFPEHGLVGEENPTISDKQEWTWYIDPIDGTTNFVHGIPDCAIIIAVLHKGTPVMSWIHYPMLAGKSFFAQKDQGAYLNGKKLALLKNTSLEKSLLTTIDLSDFSKFSAMFNPLWGKVAGIRMSGCAASGYVGVASGQLQIGMMHESYIWEYAAGCLLVTEAGGVAATLKGKKITYGNTAQDIVIACSEKLLDTIVSSAAKETI